MALEDYLFYDTDQDGKPTLRERHEQRRQERKQNKSNRILARYNPDGYPVGMTPGNQVDENQTYGQWLNNNINEFAKNYGSWYEDLLNDYYTAEANGDQEGLQRAYERLIQTAIDYGQVPVSAEGATIQSPETYIVRKTLDDYPREDFRFFSGRTPAKNVQKTIINHPYNNRYTREKAREILKSSTADPYEKRLAADYLAGNYKRSSNFDWNDYVNNYYLRNVRPGVVGGDWQTFQENSPYLSEGIEDIASFTPYGLASAADNLYAGNYKQAGKDALYAVGGGLITGGLKLLGKGGKMGYKFIKYVTEKSPKLGNFIKKTYKNGEDVMTFVGKNMDKIKKEFNLSEKAVENLNHALKVGTESAVIGTLFTACDSKLSDDGNKMYVSRDEIVQELGSQYSWDGNLKIKSTDSGNAAIISVPGGFTDKKTGEKTSEITVTMSEHDNMGVFPTIMSGAIGAFVGMMGQKQLNRLNPNKMGGKKHQQLYEVMNRDLNEGVAALKTGQEYTPKTSFTYNRGFLGKGKETEFRIGTNPQAGPVAKSGGYKTLKSDKKRLEEMGTVYRNKAEALSADSKAVKEANEELVIAKQELENVKNTMPSRTMPDPNDSTKQIYRPKNEYDIDMDDYKGRLKIAQDKVDALEKQIDETIKKWEPTGAYFGNYYDPANAESSRYFPFDRFGKGTGLGFGGLGLYGGIKAADKMFYGPRIENLVPAAEAEDFVDDENDVPAESDGTVINDADVRNYLGKSPIKAEVENDNDFVPSGIEEEIPVPEASQQIPTNTQQHPNQTIQQRNTPNIVKVRL